MAAGKCPGAERIKRFKLVYAAALVHGLCKRIQTALLLMLCISIECSASIMAQLQIILMRTIAEQASGDIHAQKPAPVVVCDLLMSACHERHNARAAC